MKASSPKKKKNSRTLTRKKSKKKRIAMQPLNDYLNSMKYKKFNNVNVNDINALRNSYKNPFIESPNNSTSSIDLRNDPNDADNKVVRPSTIAIGKLEDKVISQSREVFKRQNSVRREKSDPYDAFIKNCKNLRIVPSPMGVVNK